MTNFKKRDEITGALLNENSSALEEYKFKKNILKHINMLMNKQKELENVILEMRQELDDIKNKRV